MLQGQTYETSEFAYLCDLVKHPSFNRTVGVITDFSVKDGTYRISLIGQAKGYHWDLVQLKNLRLILDVESWMQFFKQRRSHAPRGDRHVVPCAVAELHVRNWFVHAEQLLGS